jgi:hypothetical protein
MRFGSVAVFSLRSAILFWKLQIALGLETRELSLPRDLRDQVDGQKAVQI